MKKLLEQFTKKNCKTNQQRFKIEKVINRKGNKLYVKCKRYDNSFSSCIDKIRLNWMKFHCIKMSQYFPTPYEPFGGDINVKADLSN